MSKRRFTDFSELSALEQLFSSQDYRFLVLKHLDAHDLCNLSQSSRLLLSVVREHWVERCAASWPDELRAVERGKLGKKPVSDVCRSLVFAHEATAQVSHLPMPSLECQDIQLSIQLSFGVDSTYVLDEIPLVANLFTYKCETSGKYSWPMTQMTSFFAASVRSREASPVSFPLESFTFESLKMKKGLISRIFVSAPLRFTSRFRVRAEASVQTTVSKGPNGDEIEYLHSICLRFINNDCQSKVILGELDVRRLLSSGLMSSRELRLLNRKRHAAIQDTVYIVEVGSAEKTWASAVGRVSDSGTAILSDPELPHLVAPRLSSNSVDVNAQLSIRVLMVQTSTSKSRMILDSRVSAYEVLRSSPVEVEAVFHGGADQALQLDRFDVEKEKRLCPSCTCSHKFFAAVKFRCVVKGHAATSRYHVTPCDFTITLDAKSHVCAHPVISRHEFEELLLSMLE